MTSKHITPSFKNNILHLLQQMKGGGKFAYAGTADFIFPGLEVANVGNISFPINEYQAQLLIEQAHKAPFGLGTQTVYDNTVRSAWEIDSEQLKINNPQWQNFLNIALAKVKQHLGLENEEISTSLYKLLLYEKDDFFLPHKDTEKEKGMFGTMVVGLPSEYRGGELIIRCDGEEVLADFSGAESNFGLNYAAFYADCEHEVKPLLSGYRICLVYNLIRHSERYASGLVTASQQARSIAELLKKETLHYKQKPFIFLLGHQYTPENFASASLKLNDRVKADTLLQAAELAGCYAKLCLVTSYKNGSPEYGGYEYDKNERTEIDEIYEEWLAIEYWAENEYPAFSHVPFEEEDLIASFAIEENEPLIKESSGYMGNYGPDVEHWYHYGAVMIWSKEANAILLASANTQSQLDWIGYFNQNGNVSEVEKSAIQQIFVEVDDGITHDKNHDFDVVADWIVRQDDFGRFAALSSETQRLYFERISAEKWLEIFTHNDEESAIYFISNAVQRPRLATVEKLLEVIAQLFTENFSIAIARHFAPQIPGIIENVHSQDLTRRLSRNGLEKLFTIEKHNSLDEGTASLLTSNTDRTYQNDVLIPFLLKARPKSNLYQALFNFAYRAVKSRVDEKPEEPRDFTRFFPEGKLRPPVLETIRSFMQSPSASVFEFRKKQSERDDMEKGIRDLKLDLATDTIKKGTPYTLRLTKTTTSYQRALARWKEDFKFLEQMGNIQS